MLRATTTLVKEPPSGDEWLHELKFDGYRMLCRIDRGKVRFLSRNGKDWTEKFLNVVEAVKSRPIASAILDGEIVIVDAQGQSSFQKLRRYPILPEALTKLSVSHLQMLYRSYRTSSNSCPWISAPDDALPAPIVGALGWVDGAGIFDL